MRPSLKSAALVLAWLAVGAFHLPAQTRANVIGRSTDTLVIDRGAQHGVEVGMRGTIKAVEQDAGSRVEISIGTFVVKKTMEKTAELRVEKLGKGFTLGDAQVVVFSQAVSPAASSTASTQPPRGEKQPAAVEKPREEMLGKNDKGFDEMRVFNNTILIQIPGGEFTVGSGGSGSEEDERPPHKVYISDFWIGKTEVTFTQYDAFCRDSGRTPPDDGGWGRGNLPVVNVSWDDANEYCQWLSRRSGRKFRLPTEAEWEKAAHSVYPWGNTPPDATRANFNDKEGQPKPVGSFPAGASHYGVLDMAGNVWEWVYDWYDGRYYKDSPNRNPFGPSAGRERAVRGGYWGGGAGLIRAANRSAESPSSRVNKIGFRVAMTD